jgi:hypothetical protein
MHHAAPAEGRQIDLPESGRSSMSLKGQDAPPAAGLLATGNWRPEAGIRSAILVGTKPTFNALYSTLPFIVPRSGVADTGDIEIAATGAGSTTPERGTSHD